MSLAAKALAVLIVLALAAGGGFRFGVKLKQGEWDKAELARREAAEETRQINRRAMDGAAAEFETQRRALEARRVRPSPEASAALGAPACPSAPVALGDVHIDRAIVRGLRDAAADLEPPGAAASEPQR